MNVLVEIDSALSALVKELYSDVPISNWRSQRLTASYTPTGNVGGHEYLYVAADNVEHHDVSPGGQARSTVRELTRRHWQLTQDLGQPRWYKMIVTVERSGKFSVDFEYKDDYQEGDIMKRG